jgi:hypothetical protein
MLMMLMMMMMMRRLVLTCETYSRCTYGNPYFLRDSWWIVEKMGIPVIFLGCSNSRWSSFSQLPEQKSLYHPFCDRRDCPLLLPPSSSFLLQREMKKKTIFDTLPETLRRIDVLDEFAISPLLCLIKFLQFHVQKSYFFSPTINTQVNPPSKKLLA